MLIFCCYCCLFVHFQLSAVTIKNLILFDIGLNVGFAGIVIPSLSGTYRNEHNLNETLSLTGDQSSWLGKFFILNNFSQNSVRFSLMNLFFTKKKIRQYGICFGASWLRDIGIHDR